MNTLTIIDQDSNEFICRNLGGLVGFEYPEARVSIVDVAGDRSAVYTNSKAGRRNISWQGVFDTDFMQSRRDLQLVLRQGGLKTIEFTTCDNLALQIEVEILKLVMPYKVGRTEYLIEAVAPDWRFYSQTLNEFQTVETIISGGAGIPAEIPLDMSGGGDNQNINVVNAGNEVSDPVFTINGPGTEFTIGNQDTGDQMVITYVLTSTDSIEINVKERTIILNGITNIYSSLTSGDFWRLPPGSSTTLFVATGSGPETLLTINWRNAYVGI